MVESTSMTQDATPEHPPYRTSLFFGPEAVEKRPADRYCVFNVKKRSWKGGIQVAVEIGAGQIDRLRQVLHFSPELARRLAPLPVEDRASYEKRAADLFVQAICSSKLDLLLESGVSQDNQRVAADMLIEELDQAVADRRASIFSYVLNELDLAPVDPASPT